MDEYTVDWCDVAKQYSHEDFTYNTNQTLYFSRNHILVNRATTESVGDSGKSVKYHESVSDPSKLVQFKQLCEKIFEGKSSKFKLVQSHARHQNKTYSPWPK